MRSSFAENCEIDSVAYTDIENRYSRGLLVHRQLTMTVQVGNGIGETSDQHCMWNFAGDSAHHSKIEHKPWARRVGGRCDKLRARGRELIERGRARDLRSCSPFATKGMRPCKRVEIRAIKAALRPSEEAGSQIEIEVMLPEIFAYEQSENMIGLSRSKNVPRGRQLCHVHQGDRRLMS